MKRCIYGIALGLGLVAAGPGCDPAPYGCTSDVQCGSGQCEAEGYCSFSDPSCAIGRRFGTHADRWSSRCVPDFGEGEGGLAEDDGGPPTDEPEDPDAPGLPGAEIIWSHSLGSTSVYAFAPDEGRGVAIAGHGTEGSTGVLPAIDGTFVARLSENGVEAFVPLSSQANVFPSAIAVGADGGITVGGTYAGVGTLANQPLPYTGGGGFLLTLGVDTTADLLPISGSVELAAVASGPEGSHAIGRARSGVASVPGATTTPRETFHLFVRPDYWFFAGAFESRTSPLPRAVAAIGNGALVAAADFPATAPADERDSVVVGPGWEHVVDGEGEHTVRGLAIAPDGDVLAAGTFSGVLASEPPLEALGVTDGFVRRLEADGTVAWTTGFGGSGSTSIAGLAVGPEGQAAIIGTTDGGLDVDGMHVPVSGTAVFVAGLGADGIAEWLEILDSPGVDTAIGIAATDGHWAAVASLGGEAMVLGLMPEGR